MARTIVFFSKKKAIRAMIFVNIHRFWSLLCCLQKYSEVRFSRADYLQSCIIICGRLINEEVSSKSCCKMIRIWVKAVSTEDIKYFYISFLMLNASIWRHLDFLWKIEWIRSKKSLSQHSHMSEWQKHFFQSLKREQFSSGSNIA